ncbi:reticulophagy regulator 3 isoform X2 [Phascolarctos cinereus]|uniref:Protein FAM134C isoform X1 n=1 Tax=Phascolarctos cinereus TaxID=38626 RepID=A0A6P5J1U7_PHACI|nr:protein FAM134C isoform X1 [Phascolarctos cinereus]
MRTAHVQSPASTLFFQLRWRRGLNGLQQFPQRRAIAGLGAQARQERRLPRVPAPAQRVFCHLKGRGPGCCGSGREMAEADESAAAAAAAGPGAEQRPVPAFRSRGAMSGSGERDRQVEAVQRALLDVLGPYEPLLSRVQAALVWERPARSALWCLALNAAFWFFALTSLRLVFLLAFSLMIIVCIDQWKNKIWPEMRVARPDALDNESWGFVHPRLLSMPELCHHVAEGWVSGTTFIRNLFLFKKQNPGKFCLLSCGILTFLAVLGRYIPGLLLSYLFLLSLLLWPLAVYHRLGQRLSVRLEPALQRLDFSVRGYMMSRQRERHLRRARALHSDRAVEDNSDSEEELAAFCPQLDDSTVARELAITDSEHSDAEVSCTDNGTFNLSRGQTPLTEGSEDLDGHSDPEESFARDLPDFPSINVDATGLDDEDDTSIGLPSLAYRSPAGAEEPTTNQDEAVLPELLLSTLPTGANLTSNLASLVSQGMIQLALSRAQQQAPPAAPQRAARGFLRAPSSDLDTDAEGDDFELLDQSELNQLDPSSSRSH